MQVRSLVIRVLAFAGALTAGIAASILFSSTTLPVIEPVPYVVPIMTEDGTGSSYHGSAGRGTGISKGEFTPLKILTKPRPLYTEAARDNNVEGEITLRVTFLASGEIGSINVVSGLPDGLNEQTIRAARDVKFAPQMHRGEPVTVQKTLKYSFSIY